MFTGLLFLSIHLSAQIPPGYYDAVAGLNGDTLRRVLHNIIRDHQVQTYSSIWSHFQRTDRTPIGNVWDIYSDVPGGTPAYSYSFVVDQCGNYAKEGDCYNREHTVPASWFNNADTVYTDLFHIYPTDGFVNGKRSNYPFGEVANPSWTSTNGSKLGNMIFPGYSGTVFEPIDEYKGDLARTYFYMAVRYLNKLPSWSSPMFAGDSLTLWTKNLLLKWHYQDTVSQKELNRNDSVYLIQDNRNPFIDHPEWVAAIWDKISSNPDQMSKPESSVTVACTNDAINIFNPDGLILKISLFTVTGARMLETVSIEKHLTLNPTLKPGIYILVLESPGGIRSVRKVVIAD
ncbi:MAG: endonuclease [Bacteroidales bacterium]